MIRLRLYNKAFLNNGDMKQNIDSVIKLGDKIDKNDLGMWS